MPPATPQLNDIAASVHALAVKVDTMLDTQQRMADAIIKLAVIEERQTQTTLAQERFVTLLDKLDERITTLEIAAPMQKQTSNWVLSGVWAAAGLLVMFVGKQLGLL